MKIQILISWVGQSRQSTIHRAVKDAILAPASFVVVPAVTTIPRTVMFGIFVFGEFSYVWSGPMMMRMTIVTVMTIIKMIFRVCWFDNIISAWTMVIILVKITSCPSQWQQHQVYAKWTSGEHSRSICCIFLPQKLLKLLLQVHV